MPGARLSEEAVYFDLWNPVRGEFTGMYNMTVGPDSHLVPERDSAYD